jgi:hypothetical protein
MSADTQHFTGTDQYIATDSLKLAVKAASFTKAFIS